MRVTGDYRCDSRRYRSDGFHVMDHQDGGGGCRNHPCVRQRFGPDPVVAVAPYGDDGGNRFQRLKHFRRPDIPGMDDEIAFRERCQSLRTNEAVRVGDDADVHVGAASSSEISAILGSHLRLLMCLFAMHPLIRLAKEADVHLHILDDGKGQALLAVPGMATDRAEFAQASQCPVQCGHLLPGHDRSPFPTVNAWPRSEPTPWYPLCPVS